MQHRNRKSYYLEKINKVNTVVIAGGKKRLIDTCSILYTPHSQSPQLSVSFQFLVAHRKLI